MAWPERPVAGVVGDQFEMWYAGLAWSNSSMDFESPHRRLNPLTGEWVLVSPHRAERPWLGQVETDSRRALPTYDPECYLCPGNVRARGVRNPPYTSTFVFENDFAALLPKGPLLGPGAAAPTLFAAEPEKGVCRVVCFSPRHDLTLPELAPDQVEAVVRAWADQTRDLGGMDFIRYVQVFENKGEMMGCSNPHPHSQIWATEHLPTELAKELSCQEGYRKAHGRCLLCECQQAEMAERTRVVEANEHFVAVVPFWAVWPFELLVMAREHACSLQDLSAAQVRSLAALLRRVTARYDNLFGVSFPYSMGFHQAPVRTPGLEAFHLHAHFYPPLLRSATVRKFMVGFEMLAMPQRDLTPEAAAERLRSLSAEPDRLRAAGGSAQAPFGAQ